MEKQYFHPGWTGEPYASDFEAQWGLIRLNEMLNCTDFPNTGAAALDAARMGYSYFIGPNVSKFGTKLYRVKASGVANCIYGHLKMIEKKARKAKDGYQTDLRTRIVQMVRVARSRAKANGIPHDLDENDIYQRVLAGICEATGVPFDLRSGNAVSRRPFGPSLDQKVPAAGYTRENVQVVCLAYNLMKSNFAPEDVESLTSGWEKPHNPVIG